MHLRRFSLFLFLGFIVALVVFELSCNNENTEKVETEMPKWRNLSDSAKYVGIQTCVKCHADKFETFQHTGMGKSFGEADTFRSSATFTSNSIIYDKFSDYYYRPYTLNNSLWLQEYRLSKGDTIYSNTRQISYIIGSGHHTNSHIINVNGYLYQAPATFYVQKGLWDLPPGFENGHNSRWSRALSTECISCHNAYPESIEGSFNKYKKIPEGIDCERCHGPGSMHVEEKLRGIMVDVKHDTDFSIVNPKKLPYNLQIDVCQRCHLQGNTVLKPGKSFLDFRPGMKLSSVMDVYMPVFEGDKQGFLMAAHAERLHKSKCFLETRKKTGTEALNCITCHNPHISVKETSTNIFNSKCMNCHTADHSCREKLDVRKNVSNNCVRCHMVKSSPVDIPHVTITDHNIRVNKATSKPMEKGKFIGLACINEENPEKIITGRAYLYFYEKFGKKKAYLDSAYSYIRLYPIKTFAADYIYYYYLYDDFESVASLIKNEKPILKDAVSNYQVGQSLMNIGDNSNAVSYLKKAVTFMPLNLDYRLKMGAVYTLTHNYTQALNEYDFVLKENNELPQPWNGRGYILAQNGNYSEAFACFKKALSLDPDYKEAHINLVNYYLFVENNKLKALTEVNLVLKKEKNDEVALRLLEEIKKR